MKNNNFIKREIKYPKYLLIKVKKNLTYWTIWIFSSGHIIRKKIKVFSIIVKPEKMLLIYKKQNGYMYKTHVSVLENVFFGLANKYTQTLELRGVGYSVDVKTDGLLFNLGLSHKVFYKLPKYLEVTSEKKKINIQGIDLQKIMQFANVLRKLKIPEVYKGKGIRFVDEVITLKESKKSK